MAEAQPSEPGRPEAGDRGLGGRLDYLGWLLLNYEPGATLVQVATAEWGRKLQ